MQSCKGFNPDSSDARRTTAPVKLAVQHHISRRHLTERAERVYSIAYGPLFEFALRIRHFGYQLTQEVEVDAVDTHVAAFVRSIPSFGVILLYEIHPR